jgi:hypothetical protein
VANEQLQLTVVAFVVRKYLLIAELRYFETFEGAVEGDWEDVPVLGWDQ